MNGSETVVRLGIVFIQAIKLREPQRDQIRSSEEADRQTIGSPAGLFRVTGRPGTRGDRLLFFSASP